MDRGWWVRLSLMLAVVIGGWLVLWPSVSTWVPAPDWVTDNFTRRIAMGLDIQGGMQLQYEVEVEEAVIDRRELREQQVLEQLCRHFGECDEDEPASREQLEATGERATVHSVDDSSFRVTFTSADDAEQLDRAMITELGDLRETNRTDTSVTLALRDDSIEHLRSTAVDQARETIANRIDEMGVREAAVSVREENIVVELPGASQSDFDSIREIIGRTARLEFKIVDDLEDFASGLDDLPEGISRVTENVQAGEDHPNVQTHYLVAEGDDARQTLTEYVHQLQAAGRIPDDHQLAVGPIDSEDDDGAPRELWRTYYLYDRAEVTGDSIDDASVQNDEDGRPNVGIAFNSAGARAFERLTGANVHRRMAIVLDDRVETAPNIQTRIGGGHARITLGGGFRTNQELYEEAADLVVVLRAGALPAPIRPANQQLIGPTLGTDAVQQGLTGALAGILLVLVFMALYYEAGGLIADLMVIINLMLTAATLAAFEATLTLPGIAGLALTVGMAVDANVLIHERMREELRLGKSPRAAVEQGFSRAFSSIIDGHVTSLISGVVLYQYGTGPIRGFAVTLIVGVAASLFTGVFCSKIAFDWLVRGLKVRRLRIG
ncbi:MAG: protein translocase subunit SecD [Sandaracinus sp.]